MRTIGVVLVLAAGLVACGDGYGTGGGCTPTVTKVCLTSTTFNPVTLTITAGTTVTWQPTGGSHTVTSDPGSPEAYDLAVGGTTAVTRQFNTAGTFSYHCIFHGSPGVNMHGTITVNP
jgi:plastocyanin